MTYPFKVGHPGVGCTVSYSTSNDYSSPVTVGQLLSIGGTSWEQVMANIAGISSTADEQIPVGFFKGGEYEFTTQLDATDASQIALEGYVNSTTPLYWTHTFSLPVGPSAPTASIGKMYQFCAYVQTFSTTGYEKEGSVNSTIKLAITGPVTVVAQTS